MTRSKPAPSQTSVIRPTGPDTQHNRQDFAAILFDRDGTLLDLQATWAGALYHMIEDMASGCPDKMQAIADYSGYDLKRRHFSMDSHLLFSAPPDYIPRWAELSGRSFGPDFMAYFEDISLKFCDVSPTLLPGVQAAITALAAHHIPMGIATNGTESSARRQMEHLGLEEHFTFIVGSDSGFGKKPDPGQIHAFAAHVGAEAEAVLMVGDSLHDIEAGKAAGSPTLGVPTGVADRDTLATHADQVIDSLADLPLLLGLMSDTATPSPRPPLHR